MKLGMKLQGFQHNVLEGMAAKIGDHNVLEGMAAGIGDHVGTYKSQNLHGQQTMQAFWSACLRREGQAG